MEDSFVPVPRVELSRLLLGSIVIVDGFLRVLDYFGKGCLQATDAELLA